MPKKPRSAHAIEIKKRIIRTEGTFLLGIEYYIAGIEQKIERFSKPF